jgi:hypothetical protein
MPNTTTHKMYIDLRPGQLHTATDVIDYLTEQVGNLIITVNDDRFPISEAEFRAAFDRTFPIALEKFFARLDTVDPQFAAQLRRHFLAEEHERQQA